MKPRTALVTNDDGIDSAGLWALVRAVVPHATRVVVVAPKENQSAVGASFTLRRELQWVRLDDPPVAGVEAWHVDGTPADCVMVALDKIITDGVDLVVSGINRGANLGNDVMASGTVGGALAGHWRGKAAFAFSQAVEAIEIDPDWSKAERVASGICRAQTEEGLPDGVFLNVNVPVCAYEEIAGVLVTRMGRHGYLKLKQLGGNSGLLEREYDLHTHPDIPPGTDIWALLHNYVSVTPIQPNLTDHRLIDVLGHTLNAAFPRVAGA